MLKIGFENTDGRTASVLAQPTKIKRQIKRQSVVVLVVYDIILTLSPVGRQRKPRVHKSTLGVVSRDYPIDGIRRVASEMLLRNAGKGWFVVSIDSSQAVVNIDDLVTEIVKPKVTPHKGGRSVSVNIRVTPETHKKLKSLGISISDWVDAKINSETYNTLGVDTMDQPVPKVLFVFETIN